MPFISISLRSKFDFLNDTLNRISRLLLEPKGNCKSETNKIYFNQLELFYLPETTNEFNKCNAMGFSVGAAIEDERDAIATTTITHVLLVRLMTSTEIPLTCY